MIEVMYIHCALSRYIDYCERPILMNGKIQVVTALCRCPIFECGKVLNSAYKHTGFHIWFGPVQDIKKRKITRCKIFTKHSYILWV